MCDLHDYEPMLMRSGPCPPTVWVCRRCAHTWSITAKRWDDDV